MTRRPPHLGLRPPAIRLTGLSGLIGLLALSGLAAPCPLPAAPGILPPRSTSTHLLEVDLLPLALDDDFAFGKKKLFLFDPASAVSTRDKMVAGERAYHGFGAVSQAERKTRYGHYFTFWWTATRPADITVRLEYRQEKLGSFVQAKEIRCAAIPGKKVKSEFNIIGDEYLDDGKVVAWRALLIENNRIVALTQSALWQ